MLKTQKYVHFRAGELVYKDQQKILVDRRNVKNVLLFFLLQDVACGPVFE